MSRERRVKFDGKYVEFLKPIHIHMLEKIQNAIAIAKVKEENEEVQVSLSFGELQNIRRLLIIDDVSIQLCRENVLEGMEYRDSKRNIDKN